MREWCRNVYVAIFTVAQGMWITLWYFFQTYQRKAFTQHFEYPELPVPVKPRYRGFHSTVWAVLNDERQLGFSIHRINAGVDDGPLIYQYQLENDMKQTAAWYMEHFNAKVEAVLSDVVEGYLSGAIPEIEQDRKNASWVGKRSMEDCCIDFDRDIAYQTARSDE